MAVQPVLNDSHLVDRPLAAELEAAAGEPGRAVERYVVLPGQACSYMIGQLRIIELRDRARAALGDRFSMKDFHNVVLSVGAVPLEILESEVDRYISTTTGKKE